MKAELARALLSSRGDLPVTGLHDALVVDVMCNDGQAHTVVVCASCGLHDADDEDCPDVAAVMDLLGSGGPS